MEMAYQTKRKGNVRTHHTPQQARTQKFGSDAAVADMAPDRPCGLAREAQPAVCGIHGRHSQARVALRTPGSGTDRPHLTATIKRR